MRCPFLAFVTLALLGPLNGGAPALAAPSAAPDSAQLVSLRWRLFSPVFPMMPADGYPIGFDADGRVTTANLAGVTRWAMAGETLDLLSAEGRQLYRFHWSGSVGAFVHRISGGVAAGLNVVIVRAGMRPDDIDAAMGTGASHGIRVLRDLAQPGAPLVLLGAAISTEGEARRIALEAYFRAFGLRALQSARGRRRGAARLRHRRLRSARRPGLGGARPRSGRRQRGHLGPRGIGSAALPRPPRRLTTGAGRGLITGRPPSARARR